MVRDKIGASCILSGEEADCTNICMGSVKEVDSSKIVLTVDRNLKNVIEHLQTSMNQNLYLDFFDYFNFSNITIDQALGNLVNLMLPEHQSLRDVIIGQKTSVTFDNEKFDFGALNSRLNQGSAKGKKKLSSS